MMKHPLLKDNDVRKKGKWKNTSTIKLPGLQFLLIDGMVAQRSLLLRSCLPLKPWPPVKNMRPSLPYKEFNKRINGLTDLPVFFPGSALLREESNLKEPRTCEYFRNFKHHKKNHNICCGGWLLTQAFEERYRLDSFAEKQALPFHLSETPGFYIQPLNIKWPSCVL